MKDNFIHVLLTNKLEKNVATNQYNAMLNGHFPQHKSPYSREQCTMGTLQPLTLSQTSFLLTFKLRDGASKHMYNYH